jgi:tetratricopeptide (TPR) repeat protein
MPKAKVAAELAVELDPELSEAHATQADVALLYDRDLPRAEASWERALTLNPSDDRARSERALWWYSVVCGDHDRAIAEARLAMENDPLNAWTAAMTGLILGLAGRFDEARSEVRRATEIDPDGFMGRWLEVETAYWAGDYAAAIAAAEPVLLMSGRHQWVLASLTSTFAAAGDVEAAEGVRGELVARGRTGYVQPFWLATAALATGRVEEALALARRSVAEHDPIVLLAHRLPEWAPMKKHPAMVELLRELSLVP